ncbi:regulatory iron-sulfur-containing complex subunit RicT [Schleiferia thermophila]|uniref:PSP1 domain-containing protein n=1 Tax=Schleiferia thermophila TaxID=884107 RepID=UPI002FDB95ED
MGCASCSSAGNKLPKGCRNNGSCSTGGCDKLPVFDWLANMNELEGLDTCPYVEVRFKGTRKDFFYNANRLKLYIGDVVVVDAQQGYDVGVVALAGELVRLQMRKKLKAENPEIKQRVIRIATQKDINQWRKHQEREEELKFKTRELAKKHGLRMKISDVEFQGDGTKATFYYTADERVDFRNLIKDMAAEFGVRVEMRQIGLRQEAARLGGIGSCGRELCCSTWLTDFRAVNTSAARYQQLSLNPQKLAGQCGKLKCCLNYELDAYMEAVREFPDFNQTLKTKAGEATLQKVDIFRKILWYAYAHNTSNWYGISLENALKTIENNKNNSMPDSLEELTGAARDTKEEAIGFSTPNDLSFSNQQTPTKSQQKNKPKQRRNKQKAPNKRNKQ